MAATKETINKNYEAFKELESSLKSENDGRFALMRHGKAHELYDTSRDASLIGNELFKDGQFSIQKIGMTAINLGFYSYA